MSKPWSANLEFQRFLDQLEESLDFKEASNFSSDECMDVLLSGTAGATGSIVASVRNSARRVIESSWRESISVDLLHEYTNVTRFPKPGSASTEPWSPQLDVQCRDAGYESAISFIESGDERYTACPYEEGSLASNAWKESFNIQMMSRDEEGDIGSARQTQ